MNQSLLSNPLLAFETDMPKRVVSLVPSWTDSLFDLGIGDCLVGVTDYCPVPAPYTNRLERIGGPKTPAVEYIVSLKPDLVIVNQEENSRESVEALLSSGLQIWLTFPLTVREMVDDLMTVASLFRSEIALEKVQILEKSVEWAEIASLDQKPAGTFCPIWQDRLDSGERWWMTFNASTYSNDVLRICGGKNVFADRRRRYPLLAELGLATEECPGDRDTRYPRVGFDEIIASQPEVILLPDEPFNFSEMHYKELMILFADTPAVRNGKVYRIDGSLLHWPGTRLARALSELPALLCHS